jgi:hypothetical protein
MSTIKTMSIIGLCLFCLSLLVIIATDDWEAAVGWGIIANLYAIPFSIVTLVISNKLKK